MRVLTKPELTEFEKTYNFLDCYIGGAAFLGAKSINEIKFDGLSVNVEIIKFINNLKNLNSFPELNLQFPNYNEIQKVNILFNNSTAKHRQLVLDRLIKYCFNNKVQPSKLRVIGFNKYEIVKCEVPIVYEYSRAA